MVANPLPAHANAVQAIAMRNFDSTGHAKARGASVTVSVPVNWKAQEGGLGKVVQSFLGDYSGVPAVLSLAIEAHAEPIEKVCNGASSQEWVEGNGAPNWSVHRAGVLKRQGKPAAKLEITQTSQFQGSTIYSQAQTMMVCHKQYMFKLTCATSDWEAARSKLNLQRIAPLCGQYFDSLLIKK